MRKVTAFELMQDMRERGWIVVLKALPKELGWIIEGFRSEYDPPSPNAVIGRGKWCCEISWIGEDYKPGETAMHEDPDEAVRLVYFRLAQEESRREKKREQRAI